MGETVVDTFTADDGTDNRRALSRRARASIRPPAVEAHRLRVILFRPPLPGSPFAGRARKSASAAKRPQKVVLCFKSRAKICPKTLDISALSAERLSEALWTVHGSDYHHFGPCVRLRPAGLPVITVDTEFLRRRPTTPACVVQMAARTIRFQPLASTSSRSSIDGQ
jgi:hypothetical protein